MPENVRAAPVPPTVIPVPALPVIVPLAMESVTVRLLLSTSAKGVPVYRRLPAVSSVKERLAGAVTVGASLTAAMVTVLVAEADRLPSDTAVVSVRVPLALNAPV